MKRFQRLVLVVLMLSVGYPAFIFVSGEVLDHPGKYPRVIEIGIIVLGVCILGVLLVGGFLHPLIMIVRGGKMIADAIAPREIEAPEEPCPPSEAPTDPGRDRRW